MGRIREPVLRELVETWSPVVTELLDRMGRQTWKPKRERRGLLQKPQTTLRHLIEGPAQRGNSILWALSHTRIPSAFDATGLLTEGKREYWLITLQSGNPPTFQIDGTETLNGIPADKKALEVALEKAQKQGPKIDSFYGNKGPISQQCRDRK